MKMTARMKFVQRRVGARKDDNGWILNIPPSSRDELSCMKKHHPISWIITGNWLPVAGELFSHNLSVVVDAFTRYRR